jgi:hypothetical protein
MSTSFSLKDRVGPAKKSGRDKEKFTSQTTFTCQSIFSSFDRSFRNDPLNPLPSDQPILTLKEQILHIVFQLLEPDILAFTACPAQEMRFLWAPDHFVKHFFHIRTYFFGHRINIYKSWC